jgi:hypothetical protein
VARAYLVPSSIKTGEIARILKEKYNVEDLNTGFQDLCNELSLDYLMIDTIRRQRGGRFCRSPSPTTLMLILSRTFRITRERR